MTNNNREISDEMLCTYLSRGVRCIIPLALSIKANLCPPNTCARRGGEDQDAHVCVCIGRTDDAIRKRFFFINIRIDPFSINGSDFFPEGVKR